MLEYRLSKKLEHLTATLSAPRDSEIALALESNLPLPDREIEFGSLALEIPSIPLLPVAGAAAAAASLASFREPAAALAAAALTQDLGSFLPSGPQWRYSVLSLRLDAAAQAQAALPVPQGLAGGAKGAAAVVNPLAVIAAVPRASGAREQLRPLLESVLLPSLIDQPSDIAENTLLAAECSGNIQCSAAVKFGYDLTWLREISAGQTRAEIGARVEPEASADLQIGVSGEFLLSILREPDGCLRLTVRKAAKQTQALSAVVSAGAQANRPAVQPAGSLAQALETGLEIGEATGLLPLTQSIYQSALTALETRYSASLTAQLASTESAEALLDCSFDLLNGCLPAWRQAVQGDFSETLRNPQLNLRFRQALLTHTLSRESRVELHFPDSRKEEWQHRLESSGEARIEQDGDGRLLVFHVNAADRVTRKNRYQSALALAGAVSRQANFTLAYSDTRKTFAPFLENILESYDFNQDALRWASALPARSEIETSLSLFIPGSSAAAWIAAPEEGDPAWRRLSQAVQSSMRRWLPFVYFSLPERYDDLGAAWPLIVYQASLPCQSEALTYDIQDTEITEKAIYSALPRLPRELTRIERLLEQQKSNKRATEFYQPGQAANIVASVARDPRLFKSLLLADALFVGRLIELARHGRESTRQNPEQALAGLTRFASTLVESFHSKLRTLYGGQDFVAFGSLLFLEATAALSATPAAPTPIQAILRAKTPSCPTQTFVNAHYKPEITTTTTPQPPPSVPQPPTPNPQPLPLDSTLLSQLGVSSDDFIRSAVSLYAQVCRCRLLRKDLEEQTALLDKLLKS